MRSDGDRRLATRVAWRRGTSLSCHPVIAFSAARTLLVSACVAAAGLGTTTHQGPAMSPTERTIVDHARTHAPEGVTLLERAVNINSGTMNLDGVRAVGKLFAGELESLGFKTRWVDGSGGQAGGTPGRGSSRRRTTHPVDRTSGHRLRAGQPVPEVRAPQLPPPREGPASST